MWQKLNQMLCIQYMIKSHKKGIIIWIFSWKEKLRLSRKHEQSCHFIGITYGQWHKELGFRRNQGNASQRQRPLRFVNYMIDKNEEAWLHWELPQRCINKISHTFLMEVSIGIIAWEKLLALTFKIKVVHAFQPNNICRYAPILSVVAGLSNSFP